MRTVLASLMIALSVVGAEITEAYAQEKTGAVNVSEWQRGTIQERLFGYHVRFYAKDCAVNVEIQRGGVVTYSLPIPSGQHLVEGNIPYAPQSSIPAVMQIRFISGSPCTVTYRVLNMW
jgi:hypothetical protein